MSEGLLPALRRLYRQFSRRRRIQLLLVAALTLASALSELVTIGAVVPFLALVADPDMAGRLPVFGDLFTRLGWTGSNLLLPACVLFGTVAVVAAAARLLLVWASQKYVYRLGHDIGMEVYRRTLYQPYVHHISRNSSALIADVEKVEAVIRGILMPLLHLATSAVIAVFLLAGLLALDARVALIAVAGFGGLYLVLSFIMRHRLRANSRVIAAARAQRVKAVQEGLGAIRDVLIDQAQPVYLRKFARIDAGYRDAQTANAFIGTAPRYVLEATAMLLFAGMAFVLTRGPGGLADALPVLGAAALGGQRLLPLLQTIYNGWAQIAGNRHNLLDVLAVLALSLPPAEPLGVRSGRRLPFESGITLENVGYSYSIDSKPVLRGIDVTIPKGSRIGIMGKTGSGKTTLMDLVMGLLSPTEGTIRIDHVELTPPDVGSWQARIAHVPQAIYLADASIAENIAFGVDPSKIDHGRVRAAALGAAVADFIESLPVQYETIVGERGIRLSGGQRQRVAISRALYRDADVIVLDEATSALDYETESSVMKSVEALNDRTTIFVVAHRPSTLDLCDIVITLGAGEILSISQK